jgi:hypothetical protein
MLKIFEEDILFHRPNPRVASFIPPFLTWSRVNQSPVAARWSEAYITTAELHRVLLQQDFG